MDALDATGTWLTACPYLPDRLGDAVHAVDVGLTELTAVGVYGQRAAEFEVPFAGEVLGLPLPAEPELLELVQHVGREVVVEDGRVDVVGPEPGGRPQLPSDDGRSRGGRGGRRR